MKDITVLYYTSNRIDAGFADRVREHLQSSAAGLPIISVSQEPLAFGRNFCVGPIGASHYNLYWQILVGVQAVNTRYVACCEDDCLYTSEHFEMRPVGNAIIYNRNHWWIEARGTPRFRFRDRVTMWTAIAPTRLLRRTLEERFARYPDPQKAPLPAWCEPGRRDVRLGVEQVAFERPESVDPILTFNHRQSLGGIRRSVEGEIVCDSLNPWGRADHVWNSFWRQA